MAEDVLWSFLTLLGIVFSIIYGYMYHKDKDKRKLMFTLGFAFSSFYFISQIQTGWEITQQFENFSAWSVFPMIWALSIAVFSSLLKLKNFDKSFKIFLFTLIPSIFIMVVPLQVDGLYPITFSIMSFMVIGVSGYLYVTRKEISDIIFLFSVICFTSGGIGTGINLGTPFSVFSFTLAYSLMAVVITVSKESQREGIATFFALEKEFEKTQKELESSRDKLMRAEHSFKALVNVIADPVVIVDKKGNFLEINDKVIELTGFSKDELLGKNFLKSDIVTTKSKTILIKKLTERMLGINVKPYEVEAKTKDGKSVHLEVNAEKIEHEGKEADLVLFHDITNRKKTEEKQEKYAEKLEKEVKERTRTLKEKEEKYRKLVELAPDSIMTCDTNGIITSANTAATIMSGYSKKELIGKNFKELMDIKTPNIPKYKKMLKSNRAQKIPVQFDITYHRKDGTTAFGEVRFSKINENDTMTGIQAIMRDITERKHMEDELKRYSERLEELVEERTVALKDSQERLLKSERLAAIGQAATMVGHDLRNPLQAIENGIYYLNTELANFPVSQNTTKTIQAIHKSIDYADNIVKDLQSFASKKEPSLRETDINKLFKETLSQIETSDNVETIVESGEIPKIAVDRDMIQRVFVNLTVNGIQAMKKTGGVMKISTKKTDNCIEVSFMDTGNGIKKEVMKKIFTPFFTTKAQGMGVGLAICKRFIELHNGIISVESEEGNGSTFTIKLPINANGGGKT